MAWTEMYDAELEEQIGALSPGTILATPGAYEVFSEALNNAVLEALARKHQRDEDTGELNEEAF